MIDAILKDDQQRPKKQPAPPASSLCLLGEHHTAKRIFERLKAEHDYRGSYTIVKDYVREKKLRNQEMFVPLDHSPGEAQFDFGRSQVIIAGVECTAHFTVCCFSAVG
jgi:hypothetical protein